MSSLRVYLLLLLVGLVYCDEALLTPCNTKDLECINKSTEQFLGKTSSGIPEYGIRMIDPSFVSSLEIPLKNSDVKIYFQNVTVNGLKDLKINDFKLDTDLKTSELVTKVNLNFIGLLSFKDSKGTQLTSQTFEANGKAVVTALYNYELVKDKSNVEHFQVGPETIQCQALEVHCTVSEDTFTGVLKGYDQHFEEIKSSAFCNSVKVIYEDVVHNIRQAAKLLPKSAFFTNM